MLVRTGRSETTVNAVWKLLLRLTIIGLVLYACFRLRNIITTLFIGAIIAYVLDPVVEWMTRRNGFVHFHNALATGMTNIKAAYCRLVFRREITTPCRARVHRHVLRVYATLYTFILAVLFVWQGVKLAVQPFVGEFQQVMLVDPVTKKTKLQAYYEDALARYDKVAPDWAKSDKIMSKLQKSNLAESLQQKMGEFGQRVLESLKNVVEIVLLPVLAFYFLIDGRKLKHEFVSLLPRSHIPETLRMLCEFNRIMRAFVAGQFILCLLAGVLVGVGLALLKVPYALTLGLLAGVTRAIPIIGPIIGGIPIILLTLVTKGMPTALAVLGFFTFLHFAESKFIMPMLLGDRMELHPVIIIVVLLIGGELGGLLIGGSLGALLGMFFAAPIASLVRVMLRRYWLRLRRHGRVSQEPLPALATVGSNGADGP